MGVEAWTDGTDWKSADCLAIGGWVNAIGMAEDSIAVDKDFAGTDCLAVAGWMVMAVDCMHVPVEGKAGTNCLTVAGEETAICLADIVWMHPSDCIVVKGNAGTIDCTAAGCIVVSGCIMADVGLTGANMCLQ